MTGPRNDWNRAGDLALAPHSHRVRTMPNTFSRRAVLMQIGAGGLAAATGLSGAPRHAFAQADARPWAVLSDDQARWLAAACDVFIPEDDFPSASQAGVVDYIDFQLATDYGRGAGLYLEGPFPEGALPSQGYQVPLTPRELILQGIDAHMAEGEALFDLDGAGREQAIQALSERENPIGDVPAKPFFDELLKLANEGYFADPIYLGNHDYAGWRMVGFPGAHAYYLSRVGDFEPSPVPPPMGIAHDPGGPITLPRPIPGGDRDG
jgi:hypothetical protein